MIRTQLAVPVLDCARQTQDGHASPKGRSRAPTGTRRWARASDNTGWMHIHLLVPAPTAQSPRTATHKQTRKPEKPDGHSRRNPQMNTYLRSADEIRTHLPVPAPHHARQPADRNASRTGRHCPITATHEYGHISTAPAKYASIRRFPCCRANRSLGIHCYP